MSGVTCPLCNEDPGPFPMMESAYGWVCRDCYGAHDLGRFVEIKSKKERVDDERELAVRVTREV